MSYTIRSPQSEHEWQAYYHFRWQQLRKPWQQPQGSEKDDLEESAWHVFIITDTGAVLACGRLHAVNENTGQIRFMAVTEKKKLCGLGKAILLSLETLARKNGLTHILLHAREPAMGFYEHLGYQFIAPSHTLYGTIKHVRMEKKLV